MDAPELPQPFDEMTRLPNGRPVVAVGRYPLRTDAYEHALVISSMEIPYWILNENEGFLLCVEPQNAEAVQRELREWNAQHPADEQRLPESEPNEKPSPVSLFIAGWTLAIFFLIQNNTPTWWENAGACASNAVLRGEWWRVFTALTLHADFSHMGANLAAGLVYAAFLLPIFGGGWTWFFILLSGGISNALNAWGYRNETHVSIGASTAVFGALGILVGAQCMLRVLELRRVRLREVIMPIGAGFALLAYLGVGDQQTDFTAHLCGLITGIPLGGAGVFLRLKKRSSPIFQIVLGTVSLAILLIAWSAAATASIRR